MSNAHKIIKNFTSDKFSPELKEKLWKWLVDSSEQAEKEEALMELWEDQNFKADAGTERSYQNFRRKIAPRQRKATARYTLRRWAQVAAVLLIPLLSIVASYLYIQSNEEHTELVEYYVPRGEQKQITLPDGTTAYLNSGTLLVYPQKFTGDIRSVYLIGEANFDVKKDKQHPFIVKTNHLKVKVLGTKFNVHAYAEDEKTTTTLESGSVVVQKANNEDIITLTPNEQLEYDNPSGEFNKKIIDASGLDQRRAELCGNDSQRYFHYDRENIRHTHHRPSASGYHRCIYHQVQTKSPYQGDHEYRDQNHRKHRL